MALVDGPALFEEPVDAAVIIVVPEEGVIIVTHVVWAITEDPDIVTMEPAAPDAEVAALEAAPDAEAAASDAEATPLAAAVSSADAPPIPP